MSLGLAEDREGGGRLKKSGLQVYAGFGPVVPRFSRRVAPRVLLSMSRFLIIAKM
jgi:hypothetical protein